MSTERIDLQFSFSRFQQGFTEAEASTGESFDFEAISFQRKESDAAYQVDSTHTMEEFMNRASVKSDNCFAVGLMSCSLRKFQ